MSKLRSSVLEYIRIAGNNSGCHQLPERSFFYKGKQFPVCARCTGVFFGQAAAILLAIAKVPLSLGWSMAFVLTMGGDWLAQEAGLKESTNPRRFVTGFLGGLGLFCIYIKILREIYGMVTFVRH